MKVRQIIMTGLMSLATLAPCKAQKAMHLVSEAGITGAVNKEMSYIGGLNVQILGGKNFADAFAGIKVNPDKKASFASLFINNYSWTKNISSWVRETFFASERGSNSILQVSPVRGNANVGKKLNVSLNPSYTLYNDFGEGTTTQGISTISQVTYSIDPKTQLFFEASYSSEPAKNLFNTHFGKFKDNASYMLTCTHKLWSK